MPASHDGRRMVTDITGKNDLHPRPHIMRRNMRAGNDVTDARRIDKDTVSLPLSHDLRVARDDGHPCRISHLAHSMRNRT